MRIIIDLDDEIAEALSAKAQGLGKDRKNFIQGLLVKVATEPIIKERYALRFYADNEDWRGLIRRFSSEARGTSVTYSSMPENIARACEKAADLVRRNGAGDREEAIFVLKTHFNNVFEVPV